MDVYFFNQELLSNIWQVGMCTLDFMKLLFQMIQFKPMKKQNKMEILHGECLLHFLQTSEAVYNVFQSKEFLI